MRSGHGDYQLPEKGGIEMVTYIKSGVSDPDYWICLCGNTTGEEGFYPCNNQGQEVEPTPEEWTTGCYVCARCGRIIRQSDRAIVGRKAP
jgi:hypothetical protein